MGRGPRVEPVDAVVAGALALAAQVEIWAPGLAAGMGEVVGSKPLLTITSLFMTVPLAWRRTWPLLAGGTVLGAATAQTLLTTPAEGLSSLIAVLLAAFTLGAGTTGRRRYVGIALGLAGGIGMAGDDVAFVLLLLTAAWVAGFLVGTRSHKVRRLLADNEALTRQRREAAARGATEERGRIARELHDVVSHRVSMMVIQAQAAEALFDSSPERARDAIRAVDEAGREALTELRALLGLLRGPNGDGPALAPQPGVDDLTELVARARDAGVDVSLRHLGSRRPLPAPVDSAAYRVVQESVTNVIKHGGGAPARITLEYADDAVTVLVEDDGPAPDSVGEGHGLAGMRERVEFVGGTLDVHARADTGFAVRACLPVREGTP